MAKPNYAFAKRQRDLAKKQKREEKQQRKRDRSANKAEDAPTSDFADTPPSTSDAVGSGEDLTS